MFKNTPNPPDTDDTTKDYSPVVRYPYATAAAAVAVAPPARDGSRRVRYVNPLTGGSNPFFTFSCQSRCSWVGWVRCEECTPRFLPRFTVKYCHRCC